MHAESTEAKGFSSFAQFYPYYLGEHSNTICRRLHFVGTTLIVAILAYTVISQNPWSLAAVPLVGYGFAWVGHFFFEHNRPATFKHPIYSLIGDWVMWWQMLSGKIRF